MLPKIDYTGKWIEDYRLALAISAQTGDVLMSFSSMDSSEWSQKLDKEVYQQEAFQDQPRKNLVLLRLDFPKKTPQHQDCRAEPPAGRVHGAARLPHRHLHQPPRPEVR